MNTKRTDFFSSLFFCLFFLIFFRNTHKIEICGKLYSVNIIKKKSITIILLKLVVNILWASPTLFHDFTQYFEYSENQFISGSRINLSFFEGRISSDFNNYNFGLSLFSKNLIKKIPCEIKVGNLSVGGLTSKLKSPKLESSTTGFPSCYSSPTCNSASLPTYTLFSKPFSTFIEIGYKNENTIFQEFKINGNFTPSSKNTDFSTIIRLAPNEEINIIETFGISLFTFNENKLNSWYSNISYYKECPGICFVNQLGLEVFNWLNSCFTVFFYITPFNELNPIFKLENKFQFGDFMLGLSYYLNNFLYTVTLDNTILEPSTQLLTSLKYKLTLPHKANTVPTTITTAITTYGEMPLLKTNNHIEKITLKLGLSSMLIMKLTKILAETSITTSLCPEYSSFSFNYISTKIENFWTFSKIKITPGISLSSRLYLSSDNKNAGFSNVSISSQIHSIGLSLSTLNDFITANSSFSFSCKNHEINNKKLNMALNFNGNYKKIIIILKISGDFAI